MLLNSLSPLKKELRGLDIPADPDAEAQAFFAELRASMKASAAAASKPDQATALSPAPHRMAKDASASALGPAAPPQPQPSAPEPPRDYYSLRT